MRAQENIPFGLTQNNTNENNSNNNSSSSLCTSICPNKGKIQTLRQRKSELEKLLDEKNLLLQQIQKQEAQIIGDEYIPSFSFNNLTTTTRDTSSGGFLNETQTQNQQFSHTNHATQQQQQNLSSSTLRRKVGSSFKLPRINKKEHQAEIENLLLEKKLQQEISNTSYKLANDLTLTKSVRRIQKAEYETAQQKLSVINQNLNILKKRQLRSHSASLSESLPTHNNIIGAGGITTAFIGEGNRSGTNTSGNNGSSSSILNLKSSSSPPPPPPLPSSSQSISTSEILTRNLVNHNYNHLIKNNSNVGVTLITATDTTQLISPTKKEINSSVNKINNNYNMMTSNNRGNNINNNNNSNNRCSSSTLMSNIHIGSNHPNSNSLTNDRRNSIKSAILSSSTLQSSSIIKHENLPSPPSSSGLVQHFDRTLKNHRSDYDINHIIPSSHHLLIDKYHFIDNFAVSTINNDSNLIMNNNYCNTFPIQLNNQHHQGIHHDNVIIDYDSKQRQEQQHYQQESQSQVQQQQILTDNNDISTNNCNVFAHETEFEMINNCNRTSGNYEMTLACQKDDNNRFSENGKQLQFHPIYNNNSNENRNLDFPYSLSNSTTTNQINNEYMTMTSNSSLSISNDNNKHELFDIISLYPITSINQQQQQQQQQIKRVGLGGFWRTLPNNERIWYSTATNNIDGRKLVPTTSQNLQSRMHEIPASYVSDNIIAIQPTRDEISDKISISSINSETNKKSKEKQWLETSLDSPIMHSKHSTLSLENEQEQQRANSHHHNHSQYLPYHHHHHHNHHHDHDSNNTIQGFSNIGGQSNLNTISNSICPTKYKIPNSNFNSNNKDNRSKLSSQSMSNKRPIINSQKLEDQSRLSHSTSVLNQQYYDNNHHHYQHLQQQQQQQLQQKQNENTSYSQIKDNTNETSQQQHQFSHHYHQPPQQIPSLSIICDENTNKTLNHIGVGNTAGTILQLNNKSNSLTITPIPNPTKTNENQNYSNNGNNFYKNFGANLMTNMSKAQEIRVESPKNMTVIQKAVFVPYKEVTKPFEMSDFYKYSTKFRQKDQQQQQQPNNNLNNGAGTSSSTTITQLQQQHQLEEFIGNPSVASNITANNNCEQATRNATVEVVK